jgi:phage protein D
MSAEVARLPMRPARPSIFIDGKRDAKLEAGLLRYELTDSIEGMARAEIVIGNWGGEDQPGFQYFDRKTIEFGKPVKVGVGDSDILFDGRITGIAADFPEGEAARITIFAEDRLQDLRMTRRTRCFAQASLGDVVRKIAQEHGLEAKVDTQAPAVPLLAQLNQTDLAFLLDVARRFDADIYAEGATLHAAPARTQDAVALAWAGTLRSFTVLADLARQRSAVVASGWDVSGKEGVSHKGAKDAIQAELNGDTPGGDILVQALGERIDTLAHGVARSADEAKQLADASYRHMARGFVTGEGVCETDAKLRAGVKLDLTGIGPIFEGSYRAISVTHLYDPEHGARTEFRCNRPGIKPQ